MKQRLLQSVSLLLGWLLLTSVSAASDFRTLDWDELRPEGSELPPPIINHDDPLGAVQSTAIDLVKELEGEMVKLPGFVVPLEGDEKTITTFLLVPYFGACIHVPPPPANQMVYVEYPKGAPIRDLWDAVWISGVMHTSPSQSEYGIVGYSIDAMNVEPYEEVEDQPVYDDPWD